MTRDPRPDFLIIGAPKAGTSALHLALATHPDVFMTTPKEPKFWLCEDAPPPHWGGPGDRHSQREWVWQPDAYADLFRGAPAHAMRGESTPFYLWHPGARRRIARALPEVRLVVVVRDPVDRAYSNWMHLWSDGLEPDPDFESAFGRERERVAAGYAPFWRYRELGLYGEQLLDLHRLVDPSRILVLRYRDIVDEPAATVDRTARFLGIREGLVPAIPRENHRHFVAPGSLRARTLRPVVRAGAWAGQFAPPQVWRRASAPLLDVLQGGGAHRPGLTPEQRARLTPAFAADIALLGEITGDDYSAWHAAEDRGSFAQRSEAASAPA